MILEKNFIKKLNKARVLNAVKSYYPSPSYEELSSIYDSMLNLLLKSTYPLGVYKIEKKPKTINYNLLKDYDYLVYCLVTIGDETEYIIDNFFDENQFTHAILLDAMASSLLFEISSQLSSGYLSTVCHFSINGILFGFISFNCSHKLHSLCTFLDH